MRRGRPRHPELLTPREQEVLSLLREGLTNEQIAARLGISYNGARYHVAEILSKLGVRSREEAAAGRPGEERRRHGVLAFLTAPLQKLTAAGFAKATGVAAIGGAGLGLVLLALGVVAMSGRGEDETAPGLPDASLGRLAYVHEGDLWVMDLPDGAPLRLTDDGRASEPRWSPSGQWLLSEKTVPAGPDEVWLMRADGGDARTLDTQPGSYAWSPVAERVAYRTSDNRLVVEDADGANRLTLFEPDSGPWDALGPYLRWSPDGIWLAVSASRRSDPPPPLAAYAGLWLVRADGSEARELIALQDVNHGLLVAGWTPDSRYVIYSPQPSFSASFIADGLIWHMVPVDPGGGSGRAVFETEADVVFAVDPAQMVLRFRDYVDFSPDGTRIAAVRGGGRDHGRGKWIAVVDAARDYAHRDLTDSGSVSISPAWSPDGTTIAFVAQPAEEGPTTTDGRENEWQRRIWLMRPDGSDKRRLSTSESVEERPQWSSDGRFILYVERSADAWDQVAEAWLWLFELETGVGTAVTSIDAGSWYYGHYDWDRVVDWWRP